MFSRMVPANSHGSCSTMPVRARTSSRVSVGDVLAVEQDAAAVELVEPHDEVHERRLARTGRSDDRDGLAGLDLERQVADERTLGRVRERHVLELDDAVAVDERRRVRGVGLLLVGVEQLEHALGRGGAGLHDRGHAAELATAAA